MATKTYSDWAHLPWAVGLQLFGAFLLWLLGHHFSPATFFVCGFLAVCSIFARDAAKEEDRAIQEKFGGLRANMPDNYGFRFWLWNSHDKTSTFIGAAGCMLIWGLVQILFAIHLFHRT